MSWNRRRAGVACEDWRVAEDYGGCLMLSVLRLLNAGVTVRLVCSTCRVLWSGHPLSPCWVCSGPGVECCEDNSWGRE